MGYIANNMLWFGLKKGHSYKQLAARPRFSSGECSVFLALDSGRRWNLLMGWKK
jgi:hypothetical protein